MTLRSNSLNPISEAKPRGPGELLSTFQHRYRQAITLWDVHAGMGGEMGAAFNSVLRREFKSITEAELKEINLGIAAKLRDDKHKEHLDQRKWTDAEKRKLVCLFHAIDVDRSGSISRNEFLEIAGLADLSRAELGGAFDHMVTSDRRRSARTPGGSVELTIPQFYKLIENMDTAMLGKIRATLPGMVEHPPNSSSLLVFDDGKQQLWRLVPGGRALVRKPVLEGARGALATSGTQMTG